jgi:hypothetical protein
MVLGDRSLMPEYLEEAVGTTLTDESPKIRFSATVGEEPEGEVGLR